MSAEAAAVCVTRLARWALLIGAVLIAGCATHRHSLDRALAAGKGPPARDLEGQYIIHYPDAVEVRCPLHPEAAGERRVEPSGHIALQNGVAVEVAGLTAPEAARTIGKRLGCEVGCRVVKYESQQVFLVDPRGETQRALPYRGPETVAELLRRAGAMDGAALGGVKVVRAHVADGRPPEVFDVDLHAVLVKRDGQTDVRLAPFDRVYVHQTKRWRLGASLPPWMRPLYRRLTGDAEGTPPLAGPGEP